MKKILKFNDLKQSRMTQFITKVCYVPQPWLKKILKFKCQMNTMTQMFFRWQLNEIPGQFQDIWINSGKFQDFQGHSGTFWVSNDFKDAWPPCHTAISISRDGESGNGEWGMGNGGRESRKHGISKTRNKNSIPRNLENTESRKHGISKTWNL